MNLPTKDYPGMASRYLEHSLAVSSALFFQSLDRRFPPLTPPCIPDLIIEGLDRLSFFSFFFAVFLPDGSRNKGPSISKVSHDLWYVRSQRPDRENRTSLLCPSLGPFKIAIDSLIPFHFLPQRVVHCSPAIPRRPPALIVFNHRFSSVIPFRPLLFVRCCDGRPPTNRSQLNAKARAMRVFLARTPAVFFDISF